MHTRYREQRNGDADAGLERAQREARAAVAAISIYPDLMALIRRTFGYGPAVEVTHQLVYWLTRPKYGDEALDERGELLSNTWVWKTNAEWWGEVGLYKGRVKAGREYLVAKGLIEERHSWGNKVHFRVNWVGLAEKLGLLDNGGQPGGSFRDTPRLTGNTEQAGMTAIGEQAGLTGQNGEVLAPKVGEKPHRKRVPLDLFPPPEEQDRRSSSIQETTTKTTPRDCSRRGSKGIEPPLREDTPGLRADGRGPSTTSSRAARSETRPRTSATRGEDLHRADAYMRRIANAIKERELLPLEENERGAIARNLKWCIETAGATPQEMDAAVHDMLLEREYDDLDLIMPSQALESLRELMARRDTHADDEPEEDPSRDEYLEYLDDLMDHTCTRTGAAMKGYFEGHCDARRVVAEATEELGESFRQHLPSLESDVRRHLDELGDYGDTPPDDQDGFDFEEHVKELEDLLDDLHGYDEDE